MKGVLQGFHSVSAPKRIKIGRMWGPCGVRELGGHMKCRLTISLMRCHRSLWMSIQSQCIGLDVCSNNRGEMEADMVVFYRY